MFEWARWCRRALVAAGVVGLVVGGVSIFGRPDREILYQPEPPLTVCGVHATWGRLLQRYSTAVIAPFALLPPCVGVASSAIVFHGMFSPARYAGMALILAGLAIVVAPTGRVARLRPRGVALSSRHGKELDAS